MYKSVKIYRVFNACCARICPTDVKRLNFNASVELCVEFFWGAQNPKCFLMSGYFFIYFIFTLRDRRILKNYIHNEDFLSSFFVKCNLEVGSIRGWILLSSSEPQTAYCRVSDQYQPNPVVGHARESCFAIVKTF